MTPSILIPLIVRYGIPGAEAIYKIIRTWENKSEITDADWAQLRAVNARPLSFYEGTVAPSPPQQQA